MEQRGLGASSPTGFGAPTGRGHALLPDHPQNRAGMAPHPRQTGAKSSSLFLGIAGRRHQLSRYCFGGQSLIAVPKPEKDSPSERILSDERCLGLPPGSQAYTALESQRSKVPPSASSLSRPIGKVSSLPTLHKSTTSRGCFERLASIPRHTFPFLSLRGHFVSTCLQRHPRETGPSSVPRLTYVPTVLSGLSGGAHSPHVPVCLLCKCPWLSR